MRGPGKPKPLTMPELRALVLIDRYRLLTAKQGVRAGIASTEKAVRDALRPLITNGMIGHSNEREDDRLSPIARMHFLKRRGAVALAAVKGDMPLVAKRRMRIASEIEHRRGIVDIHIALDRWAGATGWAVETFTTDFEPSSAAPKAKGRHKATMLDHIRPHGVRYPPDAMAHVTGPDGKMRGLLFEFERGGHRGDLSRFRRQKLPLLRELAGGEPRNPDDPPLEGFIESQLSDGGALPIAGAVRFLIVFEDEARRDRALAKWPDPSSDDWRVFFVKALPELFPDFGGGWWKADGSQAPLFPV